MVNRLRLKWRVVSPIVSMRTSIRTGITVKLQKWSFAGQLTCETGTLVHTVTRHTRIYCTKIFSFFVTDNYIYILSWVGIFSFEFSARVLFVTERCLSFDLCIGRTCFCDMVTRDVVSRYREKRIFGCPWRGRNPSLRGDKPGINPVYLIVAQPHEFQTSASMLY